MIRKLIAGLTASALMMFGMGTSLVTAATNVVVTPSNTQGWSTNDTNAGGSVSFVSDASASAGAGALKLTTNDTASARAQYTHPANTPLANTTDLSYSTKQVSASFAGGDPSYQLLVCLTGVATYPACNPGAAGTVGASSFDTLVFEPYQQNNATVTPGEWQTWDVDAGQFWSTRTVNCSADNGVVAGAGGAPFYSLADIKAKCPNAVVIGYGANVGTSNPSYNVETDLFNFNGTVYNFEPTVGPATTLADCANGTWQTFNNPTFASRARCLQYVATHQHNVNGNITYTAGNLVRHASFGMNTIINQGEFGYWDANGDWYIVRISDVKVSGNKAWFAGEVTSASNASWVGKWLFAEVQDNHPDKIWGTFTDQATAQTGVSSMTDPAGGSFNVTSGDLTVR